MKIGFYEGNIGNTKKAQLITIAEFFNYILYEKFKPVCDKIAAIEDKKARSKRKSEIVPYVTISGVFSVRSEAGLLEHSGLIAIDVDDIDNIEETKQLIGKDPYTFGVFYSISRRGLCVVVKTSADLENHKDHFRWLEQYYYDQYSLIIDQSCKDVSRARFVSVDKDIIINEKSKKAGKKAVPKSKPKKINWIATEDQMDRIVGEIHNNQINIVESYQDYLTVAFAIADGYGEAGRKYFEAVAMVSAKYNQAQAEKQYSNALATGRDIKIGSFFYLAKAAGIELRTKEETTAFAIARSAKKNHSNVEGAILTAKSTGLDPVLAEQVARKVFERDDIDLNDKDVSIIESLAACIKMNSSLKLNEVTYQIENGKKEVDDIFINSLYLKAKIEIGDKVTKADTKAIINSDMVESYHPFKEWVENHKHLPDDPGIIDRFISAIPFEDPRAAMFVRHWLLGLPASINGEVVRLVLTFIGRQETGKTYWFRNFLPEDLLRYCAQSSLMKDGDDAQIMSKNLVVCDDELGGRSKKDAQKFKEMTSIEIFTLRIPYHEYIVKVKRLALLCGTSNDFQIINDPTGNTRMLPVEFNVEYDFDLYNSIDKDQLFMELWRAYERGESWKLSPEAVDALQEMSGTYSIANFELELIDKYFCDPITIHNENFLSSTEIKIIIERSSGQRITSTNKIGIALKERFPQEIRKVNGKTKRGYNVGFTDEQAQAPINQPLNANAPF